MVEGPGHIRTLARYYTASYLFTAVHKSCRSAVIVCVSPELSRAILELKRLFLDP